MEEYIQKVIAPKLQGDGGWIEVISYDDEKLKVRLRGECSKCFIADRCMEWIKGEIKRDLGKEVKIIPVRVKPFFWDMQ
jgi:Fe-S cluster biogenesis protein NfuA